MKALTSIQTRVTDESITIFWEKEHATHEDIQYELYLENKLIGRTNRTHYRIEGLSENCRYELYLKAYSKIEDVCEESEVICVSTNKHKKILDISKSPYKAVGDGKTLNTKIIQKAIDDCEENMLVYIPKGTYMTGALRLHSQMEIFVDEGGVLQGTDNPADYLPRIKSRFEGLEMECYSSLINCGELNHNDAYNCHDIILRGKGTIASGGRPLAEKIIADEKERLRPIMEALGDKLQDYEKIDTIPGRVRPRLINMSNSQNIWISGLTLKNGASWNIHMIYSDTIITDDCTIISEGIWNGDGWDPDSSTNCSIFNCLFKTGDDAIAIKSGKNPEGNVINRPCKHIRIFDCKSEYGHGIAIGSEMSGGIEDVKIWDCDLGKSVFGIEIKGTKKRGGYVRNIHVMNCTVPRILLHSVNYNDDGEPAPQSPKFERCHFENVNILAEYQDYDKSKKSCLAIELYGFDEEDYYLDNIRFKNINISKKKSETMSGILMKNCEFVSFENMN